MAMKSPKFKSDFALLDVTTGRKGLAKYLTDDNTRIVRIRADIEINYVWGNDDGTSQEFACTIKKVTQR